MATVTHNDQHTGAPTEKGVRSLTRVARSGSDASGAGFRRAGPPPADTAVDGSVLAVFAEQARLSIEATAALARARNWGEVAQAQAEFMRGSLEGMGRLNDRFLALVGAGMKSTPFQSRT